jgi:glucose/mannose-6-phosphate isomerase
MPAYAQELPELDHNEILGWTATGDHGRFSAVFLDDCDTHPRVKERIDLTARLIGPGAAGVHRVESRGTTTVERVFSLVLLGDLVSVYLAALRGVDPANVELLQRLKDELAGQG